MTLHLVNGSIGMYKARGKQPGPVGTPARRRDSGSLTVAQIFGCAYGVDLGGVKRRSFAYAQDDTGSGWVDL